MYSIQKRKKCNKLTNKTKQEHDGYSSNWYFYWVIYLQINKLHVYQHERQKMCLVLKFNKFFPVLKEPTQTGIFLYTVKCTKLINKCIYLLFPNNCAVIKVQFSRLSPVFIHLHLWYWVLQSMQAVYGILFNNVWAASTSYRC